MTTINKTSETPININDFHFPSCKIEIPIYVCKPFIPDRTKLIDSFNKILDDQWLTNGGPYVQKLEKKIALLHKVKYCTLVCNATIGLQLVIKALDLKGQIILPSFTFIASAHAPYWQGVQPIFCDIESKYCTIDPEVVTGLITPETSAIMGVHIFSNPCNIEALEKIKKDYDLKLIFDAAHSFSTKYKGTYIGNFGDAEILSFHATKFFSTMEGGAILTNNSSLNQKLKYLKNFGFSGYDKVDFLGTNAKMSEISAAYGLAGLDDIPERIRFNREIHKRYKENLINCPGITLLEINQNLESNYQYFVIFVNKTEFGVSRDNLYRILWNHNIYARRYFYPGCHKMEPYKSQQPWASKLVPKTEAMLSKILCLPCYYGLDFSIVDKICELLLNVQHEAMGNKTCK